MMFDKFKQTLSQAGETLKEQASSLGEAAREKGMQIINTWIEVLPKLEAYGFKTTYFGLSVSLNPTLEVELQSTVAAFPMGRVQAILEENKDSTPVNLVFNAVKSILLLHHRARIDYMDPLTVRIRVRLSPEIRVSFGKLASD
jgi:hypothetical protein